jgi:transcriptional regulator with XRE-family HTH domain
MTQAELAANASTTEPAIASYESGKRTPNLKTLGRLLHGLGSRDAEMLSYSTFYEYRLTQRSRSQRRTQCSQARPLAGVFD